MMNQLESPATSPRAVSAAEFRDIIGCFASGVTVITTMHDGRFYGATASAVSSLSLEPPMMLICLNRGAATSKAVSASGRFVVNILAEDQPDVAMRFASSRLDKFDGIKTESTPWGGPLLPEALANIDCRVVEQVSGGTHSVFLAAVESATRHAGAPLAYFKGQFGRLAMEQDELAYHEIRERLTRRSVPIGQPLDINDLGRRMGLPTGSVYHCLARCAREGLVERNADGSFIVPALTLDVLLDALSALFGIWLGAIQLTIGSLSEEQRRELHTLLEKLQPPESAMRSWTSRDFLNARGKFVGAFLKATGSVTLQEAFDRADVQSMVAFCWSGAGALEPSEYTEIYRGFCAVMSAVDAADAAAATRAIRCLHLRTRELFQLSFLKHQKGLSRPDASR